MGRSLGHKLAVLDRARFVGRLRELGFVDGLLVPEPAVNVVHVHGPGGVGKSAFLREVARRAARRGWEPRWVDGRELAPVPEALDRAVAGLERERRPLLLLDAYEQVTALDGYLRQLIPTLSELAIVVTASRRPPARAWFEAGWENVTAELELSGLPEAEALELLRRRGIAGATGARRLVDWSKGLPLALTLAAELPEAQHGDPVEAVEEAEVLETLIQRLVDSDLTPGQRAALQVAAIARVTTRELLADVLVEEDAARVYAWLGERTFAGPLGEGVALHELVRHAVGAEVHRREPARERELRRRIADHLHARAVRGNLILSIDLADLIQDPAIRWGYSWEASDRYRIEQLRRSDIDVLERLMTEKGLAGSCERIRRFCESAPECVAIARDRDNRLCGYTIVVTPRGALELADADEVLGPRLRHAAELSPEGNAVLWADAVDLSGDPRSRLQAMLGMAGILRSGLANPRYAYLPINPRLPGALEFSAALGARHLPELDARLSDRVLECYLLDYGPGGLLGAQRDVIYREAGFTPPAQTAADPIVAEQVQLALRRLHEPGLLARSELASGDTQQERAASVRELIEDAAEHAFGDAPSERLLQEVVRRGYVQPRSTHEQAADDLNISRATYFRRLRTATLRIADYLASHRRPVRHTGEGGASRG